MEDVRAHLASQSKDALVELLMSQAATDAWLRDRLLLETVGGRSGDVDLATFRAAIDRAVEPDDYEDYRPALACANDIEQVIDRIQALLDDGHAEAVVELAEHAIEAVEQALGWIDDSDGYLGGVLERLGDLHHTACAQARRDASALPKETVVVTVMANLGLRRALEEAGITVLESQVGDRYVLEEMRRVGASLGGEQSGHVIFLDHATTGDGILTTVRFLSLAGRTGRSVADLAAQMRRYPQVLQNVRVPRPSSAVGSAPVTEAIRAAEVALGDRGRVLVRPSGTEPVVRVMVEAESEEDARRHAAAVADAVAAAG